MTMNRAAWTVLAAMGFLSGAAAAEDALSPAVVRAAYERVAPAVAVLRYSSEVTDPSTGEVKKRETRALSLIVSPDGLVMAHGHMQLDNSEPFNIRVIVGQGEDEREYEAVLLKKPDNVNVCFVRIMHDEPLNLPYVTFRRDAPLALGDPLMAIGILGEQMDFNRGVMMCHIGSVLEKPRPTYCFDLRLAFGYVGGPVVNATGDVVGVVGFDLSPNEGGDLYVRHGHPLVFPASLFMEYIDTPPGESEADDDSEDAWLGVMTQPLTDKLAEYWGLPKEGGVVISSIIGGSPAEDAEFLRGDVVVSFNGVHMRAKQDREMLGFTKLVRETGSGAEVAVKVLRDGEPVDLTVTLGGRPKSASEADELDDTVFGLTVRELTTDVRMRLNLPDTVQGVIIRRVERGSWAYLARMRPGVIIMDFGGYPTDNLDAFKEAVAKVSEKAPDEVAVFCRVGPQTGFFRIQPRWDKAGQE
jgi:serine protease Do